MRAQITASPVIDPFISNSSSPSPNTACSVDTCTSTVWNPSEELIYQPSAWDVFICEAYGGVFCDYTLIGQMADAGYQSTPGGIGGEFTCTSDSYLGMHVSVSGGGNGMQDSSYDFAPDDFSSMMQAAMAQDAASRKAAEEANEQILQNYRAMAGNSGASLEAAYAYRGVASSYYVGALAQGSATSAERLANYYANTYGNLANEAAEFDYRNWQKYGWLPNPVFLGTGNKFQAESDEAGAIGFKRFYNSASKSWTHSFLMRVSVKGGIAYMLRPDC